MLSRNQHYTYEGQMSIPQGGEFVCSSVSNKVGEMGGDACDSASSFNVGVIHLPH